MSLLHPIDGLKENLTEVVDETLAKVDNVLGKAKKAIAKPIGIGLIVYLAILEVAVIAIAIALLKIAFF